MPSVLQSESVLIFRKETIFRTTWSCLTSKRAAYFDRLFLIAPSSNSTFETRGQSMSCLLPFFRKITHAYQPTSFQDVFSLPASSSWSLFYFNTSNAFPLHILHKIANFYSFVCATRMPFMDCHRMQDTGKSPTLFTRF